MNLINIKEFMKNNIIIIGLIIVLVIAVILRFKGLIVQSYWLDELFSANASMPSRSFWSMYDITVRDVHPPLYQSLLWVWYHIFGFNEFAGRSLSAVIGSFGVLAIFLLGKEFFNKEVGLYAAIIASLNHFLIFYSQEVRSYSLLFLLSMVSYIYLFKVLNNYSKKNFVLYLIFTVALMFTHYFGFFLVATQVFVFIYYFIKDKKERKHLVILASITSFVFIVSLLPLMEHILLNEGRKSFWINIPTEWFALDYMKSYIRSQYLEAIFFLMMVFSLIYLFKKNENKIYRAATITLLIWIFIGYILPYIRSITAIPLLTSRNTIMVIPPLILLISYGVYLMKDTTLKIASISVIIFFSFYQLSNANYYEKVTKQQWREVLHTGKQTNKNMPIYAFHHSFYSAYDKMLSLNLDMQNASNLEKEMNNSSLPSCFIVVDAHNNNIAKNKTLKDKRIKQVLEIKKHRARGVLYAYNRQPETCLNQYNGVYKNINLNKCSLSKPYKGNPLGMFWSGSVTTPMYALEKENYILEVNAKGSKAFDEYAKLKLQVFLLGKDKRTLLVENTITTNIKYTDYKLPFTLNKDSNISFVVSFINDKTRKAPKEDRNVYLKSIFIKKQQ